ncbi:type VI secretion system membrane subunit TssM [Rhodopila sp.]|uniref:type VI secretion system membrane subunit TssM n=1 Tax=Rhodopila sp. TaxID=2480087 RepID=UPI002C9D3F29|nr:type VI secretion system membrane subunit TssM [Rhodopila sp.]HVZ09628.1 type VI secretion system membrane subunit TssM [Rhodopila sp.]
MKSALGILFSRWVLSGIGVTLVCLLVWFLGPLLPVLEGWIVRLAVVAVLVIAWAAANLTLDLLKRRRDEALTAGLTDTADPRAEAVAGEAAAMREKLAKALELLKHARHTRGYLYEQPWYVIIGPSGAGKTTALLNAGLRFPLASEMGPDAVAGVAGTRLCEWWFTDEAVLIDTSGRYTTQDSDAAVDRTGWETFLDLLKRTRPRQPLNGVLVAIGIDTVAMAPEAERIANARAIRRRIKELESRCGLRLPVYLLFTKADRIAGFTEFFSDLTPERRAQVWGVTFPIAAGEAGTASLFPAELKALVERLDSQLLDRLQEERGAEQRVMIGGFPAQLASLEQPLAAFVQEAFGGSRLDAAPMLRGVYFTSGTQEGTPIDRLTGALARGFGLDQKRLPSLRPVQGRSYFLAGLLRDVVFNEAMLVSERPGAGQRRLFLRIGAFAAIALVVVLGSVAIWAARQHGARQVATMAVALDAYGQAARRVTLDPVNDGDLPRVLPLLDRARDLPQSIEPAAGGFWTFGLSQDAKLTAAARTVYGHALQRVLLPRLLWRLETQMRGRMNQPDFLYEATRVYLMLGSAGPLDRSLVHDWMMLDWQAAYPGAAAAPMREALLQHLDALLAEPLPPVPLDGDLVAKARATFSRVSLAQRVYTRIKPSAAARAIPPWLPRDALGPAGAGVFQRLSGKPMDQGIPGFLTLDGFYRVLLPSLRDAARSVASESWVLGAKIEIDPNGPAMATLEHDVVSLYETDYIQAWDAMLEDLNVVPMRSVSQAAQDLFILASPDSPIRALLTSIARQTTLTVPPADLAKANEGKPGGSAQPAAIERLQGLFSTAQAGQPAPMRLGQRVDDHFKALHDLVGTGPGAPLDFLLKSLDDVRQQMAKLAQAPVGATQPAPAPGDDPTPALRAEAQRQPPMVARWLNTVASGAVALRGGNARQQIVAAWNGTGGPGPLCALAVADRYPFVADSTKDVPLDDFTRLFAPGGLIDGFFNTYLRPYVDMSGKVWQLQPAEGMKPPASPADLAQFQRAAMIRDLFFPAGATAPTVRFDIIPVSLDATSTQAMLDFDGTSVLSIHGPPRATQITWPGQTRMQTVRLAFQPPPASGGALQDTGPWAMFRMFGHARMVQGDSPERFSLTFQLGDRQAVFEIRAASIQNPFAASVLQAFRCPKVE